jgi:hypothetical protein
MAEASSLPSASVPLKASPLPPTAKGDPLTKDQWRTLLALADAMVPCVQPAGAAGPKDLEVPASVYSTSLANIEKFALASDEVGLAKSYLSERPSEIPEFVESLHRLLSFYVPTDLKQQMTLGLNLLK